MNNKERLAELVKQRKLLQAQKENCSFQIRQSWMQETTREQYRDLRQFLISDIGLINQQIGELVEDPNG